MPSKPKYTPSDYPATKNEVGVFTTPGYSEHIKPLWRFKNAEEAKKSAEGIWELFEGYRDKKDFVGMDVCRKFIQMGRTRSLRYALRPGGKKYDPSTGKERKRTGKVYDQSKLDGANIYENWLDKCWNDKVYKKAFEDWKDGKIQGEEPAKKGVKSNPKDGSQIMDDSEKDRDESSEDEDNEVSTPPKQPQKRSSRSRASKNTDKNRSKNSKDS